MEVTCTRCHQPVPTASCYCPSCGLPQLVYSDENSAAGQVERWTGALRDASVVEWKPALRAASVLALPAGLLSCGQSPVAVLALFWMAAAAAWAVTIYVRRQRPAWITMGAGARIGLVTGLMGGWWAFAFSGISLFAMRFLFGKGSDFDGPWSSIVAQMEQQWQSMSPDAQTSATLKWFGQWLLSPEGRAGSMLGGILMLEVALVAFAAAGGAVGARLLARARSPEA